MSTNEYFRIGSILKTKGLKGEMNIYVDFEDLEKIKFDAVFIEIAGRQVPYFVKSIKYTTKNAGIITLEDVDTIEKASALTRKDLYLPEKLRPKKKKKEFTLHDLKGFTAIDENHGELGEITEIITYPQQILASVTYRSKEVLFPLNEAIIKGIDAKAWEVYIELPEGLLDIYLE